MTIDIEKDAHPEIDCKECPAEKENLWWLVYQCPKYPNKIFPCPGWRK